MRRCARGRERRALNRAWRVEEGRGFVRRKLGDPPVVHTVRGAGYRV